MIVLATVMGCALIVAQGVAVLALSRFLKSVDAYIRSQQDLHAALLAHTESNLLLHQTNLRVLEEMKAYLRTREKIA